LNLLDRRGSGLWIGEGKLLVIGDAEGRIYMRNGVAIERGFGSADGMSQKKVADTMTVDEVARELRCSKAHVYNAIKGNVSGVSALPAINMGRRRLVRRTAFERWMAENEQSGKVIPSSDHQKFTPLERMKGNTHA
jgi:excisionase family DNA binding protein